MELLNFLHLTGLSLLALGHAIEFAEGATHLARVLRRRRRTEEDGDKS